MLKKSKTMNIGKSEMEKICACPGVEDAAKKSYRDMVRAGSPRWLADDHMYEIMHGEWVYCECEASATEE